MSWVNDPRAKIETADDKISKVQVLLVEIADAFIKEEMKWSSEMLESILDGHGRTVGTQSVIRKYRNDCRNYVQKVDGVRTIMTDKPVRPS